MSTTQGERLLAALNLRKKTRAELAAALGVTVQGLSQVITGSNRAMTAENTAKAARFLGVNWFWLATGDGDLEAVTGPSLTVEEEQILADYGELLPDDRTSWRDSLHAEAEKMRKVKAAVRKEMADAKPAERPTARVINYEGGVSSDLIKAPTRSRKRDVP